MESVRFTVRWVVALAILGIGNVVPAHLGWAQAPAGTGGKAGEWKGAFDWSARQPVPSGMQHFSGHLDLTLDEDKDGVLKGTLTGSQTEKLDLTSCPSEAVAPGRVGASLTGTVAQQKVTINVTAPTYTPPQMSPCPTGGRPGTSGAIFVFPHFDEALNSLTPVDEYNYEFDREWTVVTGRYPFTLHFTVKLQRSKILRRYVD
jgi:hypothetical protein